MDFGFFDSVYQGLTLGFSDEIGSAIAAGSVCCLACYNIPNIQVDAFDVLVNKPKSAAYRAPGSPQVSFAVESVIDEICEKMTWDKIDFRIANVLKSKENKRV